VRGAVIHEYNTDLRIHDDLELVDPGPGMVKIKVVASGVCHSDVSAANATMPIGLPCVLGHEGAGIVEEVGEGVTSLAPGDHVILSFTPACQVCPACQRGQAALCAETFAMMGSQTFLLDGKPLGGMAGCGTFAEHLVAPAIAFVKIPDDVPLNVAALLGCGVTTGVGAALNTAKVTPGSSVVVFGAGGVGISIIQGARIAGAAEIVAVDLLDSKLEMAQQFGATHVAKPDELASVSATITGGDGFDFGFEAIGLSSTIRAAYDNTRRGGIATIVGVGKMDDIVSLSAFEIFFGDKQLRGSYMGSANVRVDYPKYLRLWKQGKLDLEGMISRRITLDDVNDAFRAMQAGEVVRSVIEY
jgi:S-(hydroxymethyl)glutathione dehydrogenase / alcohol dehydrogenase